MNVQEKSAEGLSRTFEVVFPAAELEEKLNAKIEEIRPEVRLKGFRPGKVPASHIRKMFGSSIMGDILQELVPETTQSVLDERNLRPAGQPEVDVKSDADDVIAKGQDFAFEVRVEVMPEIEAIDPAKLKLTKPVAPVSDDQLDETLERLARESRGYADKGAKAKAEDGDVVVVDFVGKIDGEAFEGGSANDSRVAIGEGAFIPGFEEQLKGAKAGDEIEIKVAFPEDYGVPTLAGKDAVFETKVKAVEAPQESKIDDSLAERLGLSDLEALKEAIRSSLKQEHDQASRMKVKRALLDELDNAHKDIELPARMVESEFDAIWREVSAAKEAGELDEEDAAKSDDELKAEYREIAERRVRLGLILAEIGQKANVQVGQEELARAVNQEAMKYPGREREVVDYFQNNPGAVQSLRAPIYEEKVVDYVLELAEVSEKEVDRETLFADEDEEAPAEKKPAKKKASTKKAPAKKTAAKKTESKAAGEKKTASKSTAKKAPAKKAASSKSASASKSTAKTASKSTASKSKTTAKKAPAKKTAAKKS
ncbi:trigger factor [Marinicauda salina]|uniref:Trigger factor n=1 Tax=Marinicauda salina TaxID=2135793 RepID=A0A2U2BTD6_9PROT|nr:trigger factor [Marinicauda salina]PWE17273.1 trigger factor [Marinicauda salina]